MNEKISKLNKQVEQYLIEGVLIEEYVLKNISTLLKFMKECNICLRWIILHTSELPIGADINKRSKQKFDRWTANRKEAVDRLIELADVFSGTIPLTRVEKNGNEEINSLT
jgi:WASH complex subunit strumpellin